MLASTAVVALAPAAASANASPLVTASPAKVTVTAANWSAVAGTHAVRHDRRIGHKVG